MWNHPRPLRPPTASRRPKADAQHPHQRLTTQCLTTRCRTAQPRPNLHPRQRLTTQCLTTRRRTAHPRPRRRSPRGPRRVRVPSPRSSQLHQGTTPATPTRRSHPHHLHQAEAHHRPVNPNHCQQPHQARARHRRPSHTNQRRQAHRAKTPPPTGVPHEPVPSAPSGDGHLPAARQRSSSTQRRPDRSGSSIRVGPLTA